MADLLNGYLRDAARRQWSWGGFDCFLFAADWIACAHGRDPATAFRGHYENERSARRIIRDHGGPLAFVDARLRSIGFETVRTPARGDVGLVRVALRRWRNRVVFVPVGAICVRPNLWAVKPAHSRALLIQDFPVMAAWSIPRG